jgi:hypothetical protein
MKKAVTPSPREDSFFRYTFYFSVILRMRIFFDRRPDDLNMA